MTNVNFNEFHIIGIIIAALFAISGLFFFFSNKKKRKRAEVLTKFSNKYESAKETLSYFVSEYLFTNKVSEFFSDGRNPVIKLAEFASNSEYFTLIGEDNGYLMYHFRYAKDNQTLPRHYVLFLNTIEGNYYVIDGRNYSGKFLHKGDFNTVRDSSIQDWFIKQVEYYTENSVQEIQYEEDVIDYAQDIKEDEVEVIAETEQIEEIEEEAFDSDIKEDVDFEEEKQQVISDLNESLGDVAEDVNEVNKNSDN